MLLIHTHSFTHKCRTYTNWCSPIDLCYHIDALIFCLFAVFECCRCSASDMMLSYMSVCVCEHLRLIVFVSFPKLLLLLLLLRLRLLIFIMFIIMCVTYSHVGASSVGERETLNMDAVNWFFVISFRSVHTVSLTLVVHACANTFIFIIIYKFCIIVLTSIVLHDKIIFDFVAHLARYQTPSIRIIQPNE